MVTFEEIKNAILAPGSDFNLPRPFDRFTVTVPNHGMVSVKRKYTANGMPLRDEAGTFVYDITLNDVPVEMQSPLRAALFFIAREHAAEMAQRGREAARQNGPLNADSLRVR